jgi:hypothetical protein
MKVDECCICVIIIIKTKKGGVKMFKVKLNEEIFVRQRRDGRTITVKYLLGRETEKALELRAIWSGYGEADGEESVWLPKKTILGMNERAVVVEDWIAREKELRGESRAVQGSFMSQEEYEKACQEQLAAFLEE